MQNRKKKPKKYSNREKTPDKISILVRMRLSFVFHAMAGHYSWVIWRVCWLFGVCYAVWGVIIWRVLCCVRGHYLACVMPYEGSFIWCVRCRLFGVSYAVWGLVIWRVLCRMRGRLFGVSYMMCEVSVIWRDLCCVREVHFHTPCEPFLCVKIIIYNVWNLSMFILFLNVCCMRFILCFYLVWVDC
jgi:hypothetical protein